MNTITVLKPATTEQKMASYEMTMHTRQYIGGKEFGYVFLENAIIDNSYQREDTIDQNKVKSLAINWDDNAMDPIAVVPHPETHSFAIVNGLHRAMAIILMNTMTLDKKKIKNGIEAVILKGFSEDPEKRRIEEATYFAKQMDQVENLTVAQKHRANVLRGVKRNVVLQECIKDRKLFISRKEWRNLSEEEKAEKADWGIITGFTELLCAAAMPDGYRITNNILDIIEKVKWNLNPWGYRGDIIRTVKTILTLHQNDPKVVQAIIDYFAPMDPKEFVSRAYEKYPARKEKERLDMLLEEEVAFLLKIEPIYTGGDIRMVDTKAV